MAVICGAMPPSSGALADAAGIAPADSELAGEAGVSGSVAAEGAGWREMGRAARSSGSPNPTLVRWTGLTGVVPMLPTERATVALEPSVGAALLADAALAAGVAAVAGAELSDDRIVAWLGAAGEGWRWTLGPAWR
jgi:hypothetical protein